MPAAAHDMTVNALSRIAESDSERPGRPAGPAPADAREALTISNLVIRYGGLTIVPGANLTVAPGEFVTLLGPSGSGKTSLLRAVAGYVTPASGDIRIGGRSVVGQSPRLRNCGMV